MSTSERTRRTVVAVILVGTLAIGVAVLSAVIHHGPCDGVTFRSAPSPVSAVPAGRSPLIGFGGVAARVRAGFGIHAGAVAYCRDFADPFVLRVDRTYYAYSTNTADRHVPVMRTGGLFSRAHVGDALPTLPAWSQPGGVWAPAVLHTASGYVLYYSTVVRGSDRHCVSRATARDPGGPFVDATTQPWLCPGDGVIDPSPFVDADGRTYLYFKQFGAREGIWVVSLSPDGLTIAGPATYLLGADRAWEAGVVEGPAVLRAGATYFLFFSGNDWRTASYAIGYASCTSPTGPCTSAPGPWLASAKGAQGPGGEQFFTDPAGRVWMVFHAWPQSRVGYPSGKRALFVTEISIAGASPLRV